jgi:hypothetical protein
MKHAFLTSVAVLSFSGLAEARIQCDGQYQIVQGNRIYTPYCGDNYLAAVARSYGVRVSAATIRNSPGEKQRVCQFIGADNRVRDICQGWRNEGRGRFN